MNHAVKGALGAFVTHLICSGIAIGTTVLLTSNYDDAAEGARSDSDGMPLPESEILFDLGDAQTAMIEWFVPAFAIGLICSLLFLVRSAGAKAEASTHRASLKGMWIVLIFVNFFAAVGIWWYRIVSPEAVFALSFGNYATLLLVGFALLLLAYFISTAMFVKTLMVPSVPLAPTIRGE